MAILFDKEKFTVEALDDKTSRITAVVPIDLAPLVMNLLEAMTQAARLYHIQQRVERAALASRLQREFLKGASCPIL